MADKEDLKGFITSSGSGKFAKFDVNGEYEGMYLGCEMHDDPFKKGDKRMEYHFITNEGIEQVLASKSKRLAQAILKSGAEVNDIIKISRFGELFETNFKVIIIKKAEDATPIDPTAPEVKPDDVPF